MKRTIEDKYKFFLEETKNLFVDHEIEPPKFTWFNDFFGENGKAFKIGKRLGLFFILAWLLGTIATVPIFVFSFTGWIEIANRNKIGTPETIGITFVLIIIAIALGIITTFLVAKLFWLMYQNQIIQLKGFIIQLFDQEKINFDLFTTFEESACILTGTNKLWPAQKIRGSKVPTYDLLVTYKNTTGSHADKLKNVLASIYDYNLKIEVFLAVIGIRKNFNVNVRYHQDAIFLFCGAIYQNYCQK